MNHHKGCGLVAYGYSRSGADKAKSEDLAIRRTLAVKQALGRISPKVRDAVDFNLGDLNIDVVQLLTGSCDVVVFFEQDIVSYKQYAEDQRRQDDS